jgi:hypothetical protein
MTSRRKKARADAKPQLRTLLTCSSISIETIVSRGLPSSAGVTKNPIDWMKTSSVPAPTPGRLSGRKTRTKLCAGPAPRFCAARTRLASIPRITLYRQRIMKGSSTCTMLVMTLNAL